MTRIYALVKSGLFAGFLVVRAGLAPDCRVFGRAFWLPRRSSGGSIVTVLVIYRDVLTAPPAIWAGGHEMYISAIEKLGLHPIGMSGVTYQRAQEVRSA